METTGSSGRFRSTIGCLGRQSEEEGAQHSSLGALVLEALLRCPQSLQPAAIREETVESLGQNQQPQRQLLPPGSQGAQSNLHISYLLNKSGFEGFHCCCAVQ